MISIRGSGNKIIVSGEMSEEWTVDPQGSPFYLAFSDGTVIELQYTTHEVWRLVRFKAGYAMYTLKSRFSLDDISSDIAELVGGDIYWMCFGKIKVSK